MVAFDDATRAILDVSYRGADITRRRMENMAALGPRPGECILDFGCGQGMMPEELARAVGPEGRVVGVDPDPAMRKGTAARCGSQPHVRILDGYAGAVPLKAGEVDGAVSLQVFEYVRDIPAALTNLHRVLRQGGRLVIGDMAWGTLSWASDDPERMARMCRAWERHVAQPHVPARLPADLATAGFHMVEMRPVPFSAVSLGPDGLPFMMLHLMRDYVRKKDLCPAAEVEAWFDEQMARGAEGRFFFALTHFIAIAMRQ